MQNAYVIHEKIPGTWFILRYISVEQEMGAFIVLKTQHCRYSTYLGIYAFFGYNGYI